MEPPRTSAGHEAIAHVELLVRRWRVTRLTGLGIPWSPAQAVAGHVHWHQTAKLV